MIHLLIMTLMQLCAQFTNYFIHFLTHYPYSVGAIKKVSSAWQVLESCFLDNNHYPTCNCRRSVQYVS